MDISPSNETISIDIQTEKKIETLIVPINMTIAHLRDRLLGLSFSKDLEFILMKNNLKLNHEIMTEYSVSILEKYMDSGPTLMTDGF